MLVGVEQHVRGLDVAMHEALRVRGVERVRDLCDDRERARRIERALRAQELAKVGALHEAHDEVEAAVELARVVNRHDVRVLERHRELRLAREALAEAFVRGELGGHQLQRHDTLEAKVARAVDDAHPALPDELLRAIAEEVVADEGCVRRVHCRPSYGFEDRTRWRRITSVRIAAEGSLSRR